MLSKYTLPKNLHIDEYWLLAIIKKRRNLAITHLSLSFLCAFIFALVPPSIYFFSDREFRSCAEPQQINFKNIGVEGEENSPYVQLTEGCLADNYGYEISQSEGTSYYLLYPCSDTLLGFFSKVIVIVQSGGRKELRDRNNNRMPSANMFKGKLLSIEEYNISREMQEILALYPEEQPTYVLLASETPEKAESAAQVFALIAAGMSILCGLAFFFSYRKNNKEFKHFTQVLDERIRKRNEPVNG